MLSHPLRMRIACRGDPCGRPARRHVSKTPSSHGRHRPLGGSGDRKGRPYKQWRVSIAARASRRVHRGGFIAEASSRRACIAESSSSANTIACRGVPLDTLGCTRHSPSKLGSALIGTRAAVARRDGTSRKHHHRVGGIALRAIRATAKVNTLGGASA